MMPPTKRYVVFHDYGCEGWKVVGETDSMLEAVRLREDDIANGGGRVMIFENIGTLAAYRQADYEQDAEKRKAAQTA